MRHKAIEQQVVVVVGSASGIGRETALRFARRGARLLVADNDETGLRSLVSQIASTGGSAVPVVADVSIYEDVQSVADRAIETYGRIDTWAHIVGVGLIALFQDTTPEEFRRVMDVNLMGQVYGAQVALPHLARSQGGLIHVSSVEARRAFPYHSAYAASKHAVDGFLESLRVELRHQKVPVSVTQILPASINTPFFDKGRTKIGVKSKGIPPFYEPGIVADAILYAAVNPKRDIVVGGAGKALVATQRLSPRVLDSMLTFAGFSLQRTSEPRSEYAPNNLFGPAREYNTVKGDFGKIAFKHSAATWLDLHPTVKVAATVGAALGAGALIGRRGQSDDAGNRAETRVLAGARRS